jgi:hypothetical protein
MNQTQVWEITKKEALIGALPREDSEVGENVIHRNEQS